MPRYIDADKLIERIKRDVITLSKDAEEGKQFMIDHIGMNWFAPTEDVVPRSEVEAMQKKYEKEIAELERELEDLESTQEITPEAKYFVDTKADKMISLLHEINNEIDKVQDLEKAKQEVAKQIFEELEAIPSDQPSYVLYVLLTKKIAELKKKHIGE